MHYLVVQTNTPAPPEGGSRIAVKGDQVKLEGTESEDWLETVDKAEILATQHAERYGKKPFTVGLSGWGLVTNDGTKVVYQARVKV